ncbi:hypothetical protein CC78DRAFT_621805 [Lojkania enalia]|uniref:Uncharacterized protein n=1 Tax=Lojkania enalia TaxID=147567 RepID=A0A9P4MYE3_9PLEO|nr:hypothetical protein CC78DRAFT_621805 [Didymosphaeria enalia]
MALASAVRVHACALANANGPTQQNPIQRFNPRSSGRPEEGLLASTAVFHIHIGLMKGWSASPLHDQSTNPPPSGFLLTTALYRQPAPYWKTSRTFRSGPWLSAAQLLALKRGEATTSPQPPYTIETTAWGKVEMNRSVVDARRGRSWVGGLHILHVATNCNSSRRRSYLLIWDSRLTRASFLPAFPALFDPSHVSQRGHGPFTIGGVRPSSNRVFQR